MNRTKLKNYAPQARKDFIQAMTDRAAYYGLTAQKIEPVVEQGDVAVIGGRSFPRAIAKKRKALEDRIKKDGFAPTMEALAYTWFNRLVAIRYMELHGYLEHGYRVLSHPEGKTTPEIVEQAEHVDLPGLKKDAVIELKLAGNQEPQLYRLLLLAQCNALHQALPFLFEKLDDETELVLPDNLLHSDSLIRKLVGEIDEPDWQEVEIIGWLYQFYVLEEKQRIDEYSKRAPVRSEDIPAKTQLFTPNWIVKYLVQNTLGRQWLATYPQSPLRQQMQYYIEPAEQTPEVQEQLRAITPTSLNPEELTLLDPACGSGHILVEAYDLFKAIYQERGYRAKDIPALILQKNLFGLEIDDRAAQLAAFALLMKARADDRRIFDSNAQPHVVALQNSTGLQASEIYYALTSPVKGEQPRRQDPPAPKGHLFEPDDNLFTRAAAAKAAAKPTSVPVNFTESDIAELLELFENAKTFGSLIQIPPKLAAKLPEIEQRLDAVLKYGDLTHASAQVLTPLLQSARLLARQYDAVVANPPYMRAKYMHDTFRQYIADTFTDGKGDLYTALMLRGLEFTKQFRRMAMIAMQGWMFLTTYTSIRLRLLSHCSFSHILHLGARVFPEVSGEVVQVAAFTVTKCDVGSTRPLFIRLLEGESDDKRDALLAGAFRFQRYAQNEFSSIPGSPIAYWVSHRTHDCFNRTTIEDFAFSEGAVKTGNNSKYIRLIWEVRACDIGPQSNWRKHPKGGTYRKWFGNTDTVVNWSFNARTHYRNDYVARILDEQYWNLEGICWSAVTTDKSSFRFLSTDEIANNAALCLFPKNNAYLFPLLGFLNSQAAESLLSIFCTTLNFLVGDVVRLPFFDLPDAKRISLTNVVKELCAIAKTDWDSMETSVDFATPSFLSHKMASLEQSQQSANVEFLARRNRTRQLEKENNYEFIELYGLHEELSPEVADDQITLYRPDRQEDIKRLLSYAIGCMLGRYSLDKPGLIYAHSGNEGFDPSQYRTFRADDDGIVPLLETDWGLREDATERFVEFIRVAWPAEHLEENLKFVADSLGPNTGEQPRETIRRYLATGFYKHHLSMYKRRPIYWLFSSGKQRAFQCLVYLHRYHAGTLARMRTEYVIPLQGQIAARIEQLEGDKAKATSTSHRKKLQKEQDGLKKQQAELLTFEEKLKHLADQQISLDLDDGVKVNYAKFGDLLAESKAITGGKDEE